MRQWKHVCRDMENGQVVLDIGAFNGEYAIAARGCNSRVEIFAFEPNPNSMRALRNNTDSLNIQLEESAIAEVDGFVNFKLNSEESAIAETSLGSDEEIVRVQCVSLDSWMASRGGASLIKIDTEGAEAGILRGAKQMLVSCHPIILCEVLTNEAGCAVMAAVPDHYTFFYVDENHGIVEKERITRTVWRNKNWLLVPRSREGQLDR